MKFVNLTKRPIHLLNEDGKEVMNIPVGGLEAKALIKLKVLDRVNWAEKDQLDIVTYEYESVRGLPPCIEGVLYIVSYAVLQALNGSRVDVIAPDTSPGSIVRDSGQKVLGVKRFRKL